MTIRPYVIVAALVATSCGGSSPSTPSSPTTPTPARFRLSGTVSSDRGGVIAGAAVRVLDGPNAPKQATTDASGRYAFEALDQSGFTVRVTASNFEGVSLPVNLTADTVRDVTLSRIPRAVLVAEGEADGVLQPDGSYAFSANAVNRGDGCATAISGTTQFFAATNTLVVSLPWTLPQTMIVRPGARFLFTVYGLTRDQAYAASNATTAFTFSMIACP
jgi:hypothetical protein